MLESVKTQFHATSKPCVVSISDVSVPTRAVSGRSYVSRNKKNEDARKIVKIPSDFEQLSERENGNKNYNQLIFSINVARKNIKKEKDSKQILLILIVKAQLIRIVSWAFINNREPSSLVSTKNIKTLLSY